jgi:DeoR/GlpR family transcriptional regulator of sugar metabolism
MGVRSSLDDLRRGEVERLLEERKRISAPALADLADLSGRSIRTVLYGLREEGKVHGPDHQGLWHWQ